MTSTHIEPAFDDWVYFDLHPRDEGGISLSTASMWIGGVTNQEGEPIINFELGYPAKSPFDNSEVQRVNVDLTLDQAETLGTMLAFYAQKRRDEIAEAQKWADLKRMESTNG